MRSTWGPGAPALEAEGSKNRRRALSADVQCLLHWGLRSYALVTAGVHQTRPRARIR